MATLDIKRLVHLRITPKVYILDSFYIKKLEYISTMN